MIVIESTFDRYYDEIVSRLRGMSRSIKSIEPEGSEFRVKLTNRGRIKDFIHTCNENNVKYSQSRDIPTEFTVWID